MLGIYKEIIKLGGYVGITSTKAPVNMSPPELYKLAAHAGPYVRIAGLSGAVAVVLAAYGSHKKYPDDDRGLEQRRVFDTASRYHFIHTLSLLSLPLVRSPLLAGTLFFSGMILFCGPCYYTAFTGDKTYSRFTPIGGSCFILGWLAMCI
ncbi:transmembrane protein 256-like isoform X2 [Belonocnema kinseyi]|uniref:transmembrane protein 256-like isoform X2 n=1 Tax=Belonocnema kinseyi TaxID=2817044 RepID=UPI00143DFE65|nr:transmembrane protein 256-like isoform X2 [Belonocnema kinseyi]XP_033227046.1 transmembrane protein 256-like isoform X2 [Belonocnema kinseyi]